MPLPKLKSCLALLLISGAALTSHADPTVFSQPYTGVDDGYITWESYAYPGGAGGRTYDNFALPATTSVTAVQWYGNYIVTTGASGNPAAPNTATFEISFWSDSGGQPGSELAVATIAYADTTPTALGTVDFSFSDGDASIPLLSYRAVLPTAFVATAGQTYWISILSNATADQPNWSWYSGTGGDGQCVQDGYGTRYYRQNDCSLTLEGTASSAAPLPSTFFDGETALGNGVYYLAFPSGNYFGYYSFLPDSNYLYHFDLGFEYVFDAGDGNNGVYLYDFASSDFFYTSPNFPFPYLFDFNLGSTVYYYPDPANPGHYNTNGIRYFYVFNTGQIISK